jgi:hypothetical protein
MLPESYQARRSGTPYDSHVETMPLNQGEGHP